MKTSIERITQGVTRLLVLALGLGLAATAWAEAITKANPVTGETETYTWRYVDTTHNTWNSTGNWQNENSAPPSEVPQLGDNYNAFLIDGGYTISSGSEVEGWTLRCGAYGGANITFSSLKKLQNGGNNSTDSVWLTADASSSITITAFNGNQLEHATGVFKLTSANAGGITWSSGLTATTTSEGDRIPFHYYINASGDLSSAAAVVYGGELSKCNHVIKRVNVSLAHPAAKAVVEKKLVSFTSTAQTFTTEADSVVYVDSAPFYFTAGSLPTTQSLTVAYGVGTCELVQKSDGVYLYYIDGPAPKLISINLCQSGDTYTVAGAAVAQDTPIGSIPAAAWTDSDRNDRNTSITTTTGYDGSTSSTYTLSSTLTASENDSGNFYNHGQDSSGYSLQILKSWFATQDDTRHSVTLTANNIPYDSYDLVVIMSGKTSDTGGFNGGFAPLTITAGNKAATTYIGSSSGNNYKTATTADTSTGWGDRGLDKVVYGTNAIRVDGLSGDLTISYDAYGEGIAAVQIVEHAPTTCTWTPNGDNWGYLVDNTQSNWDVVPVAGDNVVLDVSTDATLWVNGNLSLNNVTIVNSSTSATAENPVALTINKQGNCTLTANQVNVPANVQLKVTTASTSGTPTLSAPVALASDSSLYIDITCTWATAISGAGKVIVAGKTLANNLTTAAVTFTAASSYTGGLTVKTGGNAMASVQGGFGGSGTNPVTGAITVEDGGAVDIASCYGTHVYSLTLAGTGIDNSGAAYSSRTLTTGDRQITGITLTGNATIVCDNTWGLIASSHGQTTMALGAYTLTKKGTANFWMANTRLSGSGALDIVEGAAVTVQNQCQGESPYAMSIYVRDGASLDLSGGGSYGGSNLKWFKALQCDVGGTVNVPSGKTLETYSGNASGSNVPGSCTINGTMNVEGTVNLGYGSATALAVGTSGAINVNGTLHLYAGSSITRTGSGVINIGDNGTVEWINTAWTTTAGDIFRGTGTLFLNNRTATGKTEHKPGSVAFGGILKVGSPTHAANTSYDEHVSAYFSESLDNFTGKPTFQLVGASDGAEGQLRFGQLGKNTTLSVKNLSGYGEIYPWSSYAGSWNIKTEQKQDTSFVGAFLKYNSGASAANSTLEVYGGTEVHSLTLGSVSVTEGTLTIHDNGKVIFPSTGGSWKNGAVSVGANGYLEAQHNDALGTVTLGSNSHVVIPLVSSAAVPLTATTIILPATSSGERVYVDVSALGLTTSSAALTVMSGTLVGDVSNLRAIGCSGSFTYANNVVTFTPGVTTWTGGIATWSAGDITGTTSSEAYSESGDITFGAIASTPATITLDGERTPTSVTFNGGADTTYVLTGANGSFKPSGTVTISSGTLSIACDATLQTVTGSGTLDIAAGATVTIASASALDGIANLTGSGTLVLSGAVPSSSLQTFLKDFNWLGTMWIKNITGGSANGFNPNNYGHGAGADYVASTVKVTGLTGYLPEGASNDSYILTVLPTLELADEGDAVALHLNNGYSYNYGSSGHYPYTKLTKLVGTGTFMGTATAGNLVLVQVLDWANFHGNIDLSNSSKCLYFGSADPSDLRDSNNLKGSIYVADDVTVTSGSTWKASLGIKMTGTATLTYDLGVGNTNEMGSAYITSATTDNKVIVKSGVLRPTAGKGDAGAFNSAAIEIQNGGELLLDYNTDVTGYNDYSTVPITVKSGGILNVGQRETMTHALYLEGGTLKISGSDDNRGLDLFNGKCTIYATENSTIEATGNYPIYIRGADATFDVGQGKTLTCDCAFAYAATVSTSDLVKTGAGTLVLNGYNSCAMTMPKGIDVQAGSVEANVNLTASDGGAFTLSSTSATIVTGSGVTLSPTPTTTVANHHVKYDAGVYSVAIDQFAVTIPSVANTTVSVSYTSGGVSQTATAAGAISVDYGTSLTATWTAVSGYQITANAEQTINPVVATQTLTAPTVEAVSQEATVSNVSFSPSANGKATVTATINGPATTATLTYGGSPYNATVVNGSVTFENVSVGQTSDSYFAPTEYSLTTDAGQTTGQTSGLVDGRSWINENASTTGVSAGGTWTNATGVVYGENNKATIKDNRFHATSEAPTEAGGLVVLSMKVNFPSFSDAMVDGDAQGAITLREVENNNATFSVLTTNGTEKVWTDVTGAGSVNTNIDYVITLTFNYAANKYTAAVGGTTLSTAGGVSEFDILRTASSVQNIDFVGEGVLEYLKGDVAAEGAMVVDGNGTKYATVDAAIAAYNADKTIGPLTMLHPGSVPSGWKVVNGIISKIIKGWKLIAY